MAKSVDLKKRNVDKEALLARVSGSPSLKPPPGRTLPPGVTGTMPLASGVIVKGEDVDPTAKSLTDLERKTLEAHGWTPDVKIPNGMAGILEQIAREKDEVNLPIDPRTPPLKVQTQDFDKLDKATQQRLTAAQLRFKQVAEEAVKAEAAAKVVAEAQAKAAANPLGGSTVPGLNEAMRAASQAQAAPQQDDSVEDDRANPKRPPSPQPTPAPTASDTGANPPLTECPHCRWDLSQESIKEPPYAEKVAFVHALMGSKSFVKEYQLFGGNMRATFRTLHIREVDMLHKQTYKDQENGELPTEADFWNQINRYRFYLQLQRVEAVGPGGFMHDLPDGLSKETNPNGTGFWEVEMEPGDATPLKQIEKYLIEEVLKTETVFRTLNLTCNDFNRLAAKMEAMADNTDFWKPTEAAS